MQKKSFKVANRVAGELIGKGNYVFSPISHSHPIWKEGNCEHSYKVWLRQDKEFVKWSDYVYVVIIDGEWGKEKVKNSKGVQQELKWAEQFGKHIKYIHVNS